MTPDDRIKTLAEQGWLPVGISQILGMSEQVVRRKLREMRISPADILSIKHVLPFGMTDKSYKIRAALGQILTDLMDKYEQPAVSSLTGLNRQEITRAIKSPYKHDWTISQIERTLDCEGKAIYDLIG